jgi:hypothetical protein
MDRLDYTHTWSISAWTAIAWVMMASISVPSIYSYSYLFIDPKLHTAIELNTQSQSDSPTYLPTLTDLSQIFTPCSIQVWIPGRGVEN